MKRKVIISSVIIFCIIAGLLIFTINKINNKLVNVEDITTDKKYENIVYDKEENIWDNSVLGMITIEKINLKATVKEGTTKEILLSYIGHIEETSTYDGNVGLASHNRGFENSYFARLNELELGDTISYKTKFYDRTYVIDNIKVIYETDWSMLQSTEENKLTLITCISGKKQQRLCVQATEKTCNIMNTELP